MFRNSKLVVTGICVAFLLAVAAGFLWSGCSSSESSDSSEPSDPLEVSQDSDLSPEEMKLVGTWEGENTSVLPQDAAPVVVKYTFTFSGDRSVRIRAERSDFCLTGVGHWRLNADGMLLTTGDECWKGDSCTTAQPVPCDSAEDTWVVEQSGHSLRLVYPGTDMGIALSLKED